MTKDQEAAIAAIEKQQPTTKSAVWMVGEQLKDMVRAEPGIAALLTADLAGKGMGLVDAEQQIAAAAKKNKVGNVGVVTPAEAEDILRSFYGLPPRGAAQEPEEWVPVVRCAACRHRTEPACNKADYAARGIAKCGCTKSPCYGRLVYLTEFCRHGEREEDW